MRHLVSMAALLLVFSQLCACGGGGSDDETALLTPREVGAAFLASDGRIALVSKTGDRVVYFDMDADTFSSAQPLSALYPSMPALPVGSAAEVSSTPGGEIRFSDHLGEASITYDPITGMPGTSTQWDDLVSQDARIGQVSAMFVIAPNLFVFNPTGSKYAAVSLATHDWSPEYGFASDFGGGATPISSVGAAFVTGAGHIYLFDQSGTAWTVYSGGGQFTPAGTLDELGDGTLSFN